MAIIVKGTVKIARPIVPTDIAGLKLWLDASDSTTLFQNSNGTTPAIADSDQIGYWGDKSGNGKNAIQADSTKKPILKTGLQNGKNVLLSDGVNDVMVLPSTTILSQPFTYFIAMKFLRTNVYERVTMGYNDGGNFEALANSGYQFYSGSAFSAGTRNTNSFLLTAVYNSTASSARINATSLISGNLGVKSPGELYIFSGFSNSNPSNMRFYEFLIYDSVLPDNNRNSIESYLNTKWGIY